ncbi:MAG: hypothetical protein ACR2IM_09705, partial [Sediminibacterium sp.]
MNKKIQFPIGLKIFIFLCLFGSNNLKAQTTNNGIFFQAVARDIFSNPAMNRKIYLETNIIQKSVTGTKVLTEEHQTNTDATGVFSISIGKGSRIGGTATNLASIDWANGPYFLNLKIAITPTAPVINWNYKTEWIDLGTTLFGAVPYALYAGTAEGINDKLNINDTSSMLAVYAKSITIKKIENIIDSKISSTDTAAMLAPYKKIVNDIINSNITSLTADAINASLSTKLNLIDSNRFYITPSQLAAKTFDISPINNAISVKLNIADTADMLSNRFKRDTASLSNRINLKVDKETGKVLSSNDYTNTEKAKLAAIIGNNTGDQDLSSFATNSNLN